MVELKQTLKLTQQLVMTPQLQQAIKLLQMSRMELVETIAEEMETNPALEEGADQDDAAQPDEAEAEAKEKVMGEVTEEVSSTSASEKELDWEQYIDSYNANDFSPVSYEREEAPVYDNIIKSQDTLADHLLWQMRMTNLDEKQKAIGEFIIGNIDEDGYIKISLDEVASDMNVSVEEAEEVLGVIQEFDPVGIAARDLKECLLIQARYLGLEDSLVGEIISNHLENIEKRKIAVIVRETGTSTDEVIAAVKIITEMEPRPGRPFSSDNTQYIVPDVYVYKVGDDFNIVLNDEGLPRLRVSSYYRGMIHRGESDGNAKEYIQERLRSAMWLIKSIQQRQRTIYRVMESLLEFQRDFFEKGVQYLRPLVLKDVADAIGMHESTISRVTNNKYVYTSHGIFELKYFFNSGISRFGEEDIASESVKERIKQLIDAEPPNKPLSDQAIVNLLKAAGINIARRTVTKYREMMGISSSSKRKKLF